MKVSKIVVLAALTASFSHYAVAKDAMYKWCAEEPAAPVVVQPQVERINLSADALFRFDRHQLKDILPQGKATLDELADKLTSRQATIESILLIGHTDRLGSEAYNQKLGLQRAQTVKEYLQSKGVQSPISVKSAGETEPVTADCVGNQPTAALKACLQPDRRVAVDITGTVAQ